MKQVDLFSNQVGACFKLERHLRRVYVSKQVGVCFKESASFRFSKIKKCTAQKMKFSIKDFFSKCDQIRSFLRIWSHLLKQNFIFCAVTVPSEGPFRICIYQFKTSDCLLTTSGVLFKQVEVALNSDHLFCHAKT